MSGETALPYECAACLTKLPLPLYAHKCNSGAVPPTTDSERDRPLRAALAKAGKQMPLAWYEEVWLAVNGLVAAEVAAARADDVERICAVCRLLLNSGDITPMGARLIEQAADRSVTSRLGAVRD